MNKLVNKNKAVIVIICALLIAAVMCTLIVVNLSGPDPVTSPAETENTVIDGNGKALESGKIYELPSQLIFTSAAAASSEAPTTVQVTARIEPASATFKELKWELSFSFPEGYDEASKAVYISSHNPSEFIDMTVTGTTASISMKKILEHTIVLKVSSVRQPDKYVECRIDYLRRPKVSGVILNAGLPDEEAFNQMIETNISDAATLKHLSFVKGYEDKGTLREDYNINSVKIKINPYIKYIADFLPSFRIDRNKLNTEIVYNDQTGVTFNRALAERFLGTEFYSDPATYAIISAVFSQQESGVLAKDILAQYMDVDAFIAVLAEKANNENDKDAMELGLVLHLAGNYLPFFSIEFEYTGAYQTFNSSVNVRDKNFDLSVPVANIALNESAIKF